MTTTLSSDSAVLAGGNRRLQRGVRRATSTTTTAATAEDEGKAPLDVGVDVGPHLIVGDHFPALHVHAWEDCDSGGCGSSHMQRVYVYPLRTTHHSRDTTGCKEGTGRGLDTVDGPRFISRRPNAQQQAHPTSSSATTHASNDIVIPPATQTSSRIKRNNSNTAQKVELHPVTYAALNTALAAYTGHPPTHNPPTCAPLTFRLYAIPRTRYGRRMPQKKLRVQRKEPHPKRG